MKKKIQPEDQSEGLIRAKLEFILRNQEEYQKLKELIDRNDKKRDQFTTALATIGGKFDPEQKERWDFLYEHSEVVLDVELAEYLKTVIPPPAVNSVWRWLDYTMEIAYQELATMEPVINDNKRHEYLKTKVFDMYCRDARGIFTELTNDRPAVHLLMGIDLTRNKGAILKEVEKLVTEYQTKIGVHEMPERRFKWLSNVGELLEVWDLYNQAGQQPWRKTFREISKKVGRPLSTVKDQWRLAFGLIYRKPYKPESKYTTDEKKLEATKICAACPHLTKKGATCQKGNGEWQPCSEYLSVAGKERSVKFVEYLDDLLYHQ